MSVALSIRQAAVSGLALAAATALWWLGSTRLALQEGADAGRIAEDTLRIAWAVRGTLLVLLGARTGALRGWRSGARESLTLCAQSWPVLVLAWAASPLPWSLVLARELVLLAAGAALPWLGERLARMLPKQELADALSTGLGVALAAALWLGRGHWLPAWA
jgi:hypothetical protein